MVRLKTTQPRRHRRIDAVLSFIKSWLARRQRADAAMTAQQRQGQWAEQLAKRYLQTQGLRFIEANYRCPVGEIDLIFKDQAVLVFVEVRSRSTASFGSAFQSVDRRKQKKLQAAASHYIRCHAHAGLVRFDIVALEADGQLKWFKRAFA